jgi:hypothetical protein
MLDFTSGGVLVSLRLVAVVLGGGLVGLSLAVSGEHCSLFMDRSRSLVRASGRGMLGGRGPVRLPGMPHGFLGPLPGKRRAVGRRPRALAELFAALTQFVGAYPRPVRPPGRRFTTGIGWAGDGTHLTSWRQRYCAFAAGTAASQPRNVVCGLCP